jgi:formylglycine-generating enzyme required for sulfatase activity
MSNRETSISRHAQPVLAAALCVLLPGMAVAQLQLGISAASSPQITVTGPTGTVVEVQWSDALNDSSRWFYLTNGTFGSPVQLNDPNAPLVGARFYRAVTVPTADMVLIPGGSFAMGDTFNDGFPGEKPVHTATVSAFYLAWNEVRFIDWGNVYIWAVANGYTFDNEGGGKAVTHPVNTINWYDAVKWCNARSENEGLTPCYYTDAAQTNVYRTGQIDLTAHDVRWSANGYRLPTEAEWERAARGGQTGWRFPWGQDITFSNANYQSFTIYSYDQNLSQGYHPTYATNDYPYTSPVGSFPANGYGLFDMVGNVWEWCWDRYDASWYASPAASQSDTKGPSGPTANRVLRGGSWNDCRHRTRKTSPWAFGVRWRCRDFSHLRNSQTPLFCRTALSASRFTI